MEIPREALEIAKLDVKADREKQSLETHARSWALARMLLTPIPNAWPSFLSHLAVAVAVMTLQGDGSQPIPSTRDRSGRSYYRQGGSSAGGYPSELFREGRVVIWGIVSRRQHRRLPTRIGSRASWGTS